MLIPSIDLMDGRIVQLVQGEKRALAFDNFEEWIARFSSFPIVQLIDLDAAKGEGNNHALMRRFCKRLPCQVGGGVRSIHTAKQLLEDGARRVIFGSSLVRERKPDVAFAEQAAQELGTDKLVFAIDAKEGRIAVRGWREQINLTPLEMIAALDPWCAAFLYTHIDTEGMMQGMPLGVARELRSATKKQLIVAGGIASSQEVHTLDRLNIDAVVGMAIYTGRIQIDGHTHFTSINARP